MKLPFFSFKSELTTKYQTLFYHEMHQQNAKRMIVILMLVALFEFLVFLFEALMIEDKTEFIPTMINKLIFVVLFLGFAFILKSIKDKEHFKLLAVIIYSMSVVSMLMGAMNTFLVQEVMPDITIFLLILFITTAVVRMEPKISAFIYVVVLIFFTVGIARFQDNADYVTWDRINGLISVTVAFVISALLYNQSTLIFMDRLRIEKQNEKLRYLANYDQLTTLLNHQKINEVIEQQKILAKENSTALCLAVIDVDNFKKVNDTYGHSKGDELIKYVADILKTLADPAYYIGRYGGDEFIVLMPNTSLLDAIKIIELMTQTVEMKCLDDICITLSSGIAELSSDNYSSFLEEADMKMYISKNSGKNRVTA